MGAKCCLPTQAQQQLHTRHAHTDINGQVAGCVYYYSCLLGHALCCTSMTQHTKPMPCALLLALLQWPILLAHSHDYIHHQPLPTEHKQPANAVFKPLPGLRKRQKLVKRVQNRCAFHCRSRGLAT